MNLNISEKEFMEKYVDFLTKLHKNADFKKELTIHKALSSKLGLEIYNLLQQEEMCNCAIAGILGKNQATIAHHLRKLEQAGLIIGRKKSYFSIYTIYKKRD